MYDGTCTMLQGELPDRCGDPNPNLALVYLASKNWISFLYRDECSHRRRTVPPLVLSRVFCIQETPSHTYICFGTLWKQRRPICHRSRSGRRCTCPRRAYFVFPLLRPKVLNSTKGIHVTPCGFTHTRTVDLLLKFPGNAYKTFHDRRA